MPPQYRKLENYPDGVVLSQNIIVNSRRTSLRLGKEVLSALHEIAGREGITFNALCTAVAKKRSKTQSLTEALRSYALCYFREAATEEGHRKARHGSK